MEDNMAENFREFQPGNSSENGRGTQRENNKNNSFGRLAAGIAILFVLAVLALGSVYSIGEQEQGVVTTFGNAGSVVTSGLHFKIPFVQRVTKVNTTILGFPIGYRSGSEENASQEQIDDESLMITSDFNFVNVDFYVEYKVSDPVKYLYNSQQPKEILKNIAQSCIRNIISNYVVDDVITTGKSKIQAEIKEMNKTDAAKVVGKKAAEKALAKGVKTVVFDRGGYLYTGRVQAVADGAREAGLNF